MSCCAGYHGNKNISVWSNCNREVVDPPRYMEFVAAARWDFTAFSGTVFQQKFTLHLQFIKGYDGARSEIEYFKSGFGLVWDQYLYSVEPEDFMKSWLF
jgi:hypothetical protein